MREGKKLAKVFKNLAKKNKTVDFEKIGEDFPGKKEETLKTFYREYMQSLLNLKN